MGLLAWQCKLCSAFNSIFRIKCGKCKNKKKIKMLF